jgi:hypothetical protein
MCDRKCLDLVHYWGRFSNFLWAYVLLLLLPQQKEEEIPKERRGKRQRTVIESLLTHNKLMIILDTPVPQNNLEFSFDAVSEFKAKNNPK